MNKKGFTIIELVTALTLATVIMIFLFNLVFILKDVYMSSEKKATMLVEQAAISEEVNSFVYGKKITSVEKIDDNSIDITTSDGTKRLKITKQNSNNRIEFGNYLYKLDTGVNIGTYKICYKNLSSVDANNYNRILFIDIPITYKDIKGNYGLKTAVPLENSTILKGSLNLC